MTHRAEKAIKWRERKQMEEMAEKDRVGGSLIGRQAWVFEEGKLNVCGCS